MIFRDRSDAGRQLAARLTRYADRTDVLVLALPREIESADEVKTLLRFRSALPAEMVDGVVLEKSG